MKTAPRSLVALLQARAINWRRDRNDPRRSSQKIPDTGFVVFWGTTAQGWTLCLTPNSWRPGCYAVSHDGKVLEGVGGSYNSGAKNWTELVVETAPVAAREEEVAV